MSNNEKFNLLLNSTSNPRAIYNVLASLAEAKPNLMRVAQEIAGYGASAVPVATALLDALQGTEVSKWAS